MTGIAQLPDLGWILESLTKLPGVRHAVVLSEDGLLRGRSSAASETALDNDTAEKLSATSAALAATSKSAATLLYGDDTTVRQVLVESDRGFVLFTSAGVGGQLGVDAALDADMGQVAHEMQVLVVKINEHLSSPARKTVSPPS
ncbi:roadblock/LC7 domain-containing protein [Streptomyces sp. 8L]|uniref:roadblock/LC7 domain-containing protein n=1 Tax=unclassified Streptomyces TaxID=2593676 RepID=UPI001CD339A9|nr:roadblock/LC7 domain-containing protein [Streptomyces sp. 8L]MCA1217072.1 roadblock/LC7 domain-containing protein [Streptomyces sp. 8L]